METLDVYVPLRVKEGKTSSLPRYGQTELFSSSSRGVGVGFLDEMLGWVRLSERWKYLKSLNLPDLTELYPRVRHRGKSVIR